MTTTTARKLLIVPALIGLVILAGCNTVRGAGKDLETAADATSKAIDKAAK